MAVANGLSNFMQMLKTNQPHRFISLRPRRSLWTSLFVALGLLLCAQNVAFVLDMYLRRLDAKSQTARSLFTILLSLGLGTVSGSAANAQTPSASYALPAGAEIVLQLGHSASGGGILVCVLAQSAIYPV